MTSNKTSPPTTSGGIYFQALGTDQIRVLALQPGSNDEPLACHLRIVNVQDTTSSYKAVSYVWGSQETPAVIRCRTDDTEAEINLPITQNAAEALRAVRKPQAERLVWIDSICISQTSRVEKGTQVAMMDRIFTNAAAVLVWLGPADETRPAGAEELFNRLTDKSMTSAPQWWQGESYRFYRSSYVKCRPQKRYSRSEIHTLLSVFESPWFWRLWCVQELVLAQKAFVYWGSVRVAWKRFASAAAYVQFECGHLVAHTGLSGVYNVAMLESFRRRIWTGHGISLPFSRLLNLTRQHGVTEHRDRIFSMLGLDEHLSRMDSRGTPADENSPLVQPDYSQKLEGLYYKVAERLLAREKNLYLLSFVQHDEEVGSSILPSWVPQWHINEHRLITQFNLIAGHPVNGSLRVAWAKSANNACPSTDSQESEGCSFEVTAEGSLQVDGLHLDTVVA